MSKRVLFIANHRLDRSPGQRFRFEQYLGFLEANGFECELSNIISKEDDAVLYKKGNLLKKANIARKAYLISNDLKRADEFDIIFIFREALLTASSRFERLLSKSSAKVVVDFDDAIWLPNVSAGNRSLQVLKNPSKSDKIFSYADMIFAGNNYLAKYAAKFCNNVKVIPTTIDTDYHIRRKENTQDKVCIGWTGTQTTLKYLNFLNPVFRKLNDRYRDNVYLKVICDTPWETDTIKIVNEKWSRTKEIEQLEEIDVGIMPLTNDQWSKGKCGFKGLQYMAMESAAILSPVGVNKEIIDHKKNGLLAKTEEEWFNCLTHLIENKNLRKELGKEGRKTVVEKYSVKAYKQKYLDYFNELIN